MPTPTYDLIEEQVLANSTTTSITLGSGGTIPQTYTHLVIEIAGNNTAAGWNWDLRFNGDTGTNYSSTIVEGTGTAAGSSRTTNTTRINTVFNVGISDTSYGSVSVYNVFSYRDTNVNKTMVGRLNTASSSAYPGTSAIVGLWRNTAAITSITILTNSASVYFNSGTVIRLWGLAG